MLMRLCLQNDPVFKKCEITYVPIFLGGVMKACGNTAPINIKSR
jgi:2-hydroxychromene-2-carboxylate isomerase